MIMWIYKTFLLIFVVLLAACGSFKPYAGESDQDIRVHLEVTDQNGKSIPYVQVWAVVLPRPDQGKLPGYRPFDEVSFEYLDHLTSSYRYTAEYVNHFSPTKFSLKYPYYVAWPDPIPQILTGGAVRRMSIGQDGELRHRIGGMVVRPDLVSVKYSFLKYGYIPANFQFQISKNELSIKNKVIMRRDPAIDLPTGRYWQTFNRIMFDSEFGSPNYLDNPEPYREELMDAAKQAIRAGDKKSASMIFSWIPSLFTMNKFDYISGQTRVLGFNRERYDSSRNMELFEKAIRLDSSNRYAKMMQILLTTKETQQEWQSAILELIDNRRDGIWPVVFHILEKTYYYLGRRDLARKEFDWFLKYDPLHRRNQHETLKSRFTRYISLDEFKKQYVKGKPNQIDEYHNLPVYYAVREGRVDLYKWLLKNGVESPLPVYMLHQALGSQSEEMVRLLLETDRNITGINANIIFRETPRLDENNPIRKILMEYYNKIEKHK